jgi:shikimate kinase
VNKRQPVIVLVGLMGTGKSTVAWDLAQRFAVPCLDTDKLVEQRTGHSVRDVFSVHGEEFFRDVESEVLKDCLHSPDGAVIAGAGGVVIRATNRQLLAEKSAAGDCVVVWLTASPEVLAQRTAKGTHRPLLDGDRLAVLHKMAIDREALYKEVADIVIDVSDRPAESVVSLIVSAIDLADDEKKA